jgi:NADH-quinone oxidoreductase subunit C
MKEFFNDLKFHLEDKLEIQNIQFVEALNEFTLIVPSQQLIDVIGILKHSAKFLQLTDLTAVDYPSRPKRFEIVYHLLNMHRNARLRVKTSIHENEAVPSLCRIYNAANWYEREVFDMFGITFDQHPNLQRILTDYDFEAYPMRKDFPTEGRMEVHYDEANRCVTYDPVNLPQARRKFNFMVSKWADPTYEQPNSEETKNV